MADLYKADGHIVNTKPANGEAFTMEELMGHIGGYVEIVARSHSTDDQELLLIGDEDGKLIRKPYNVNASVIAGTALVGDILIITNDEAATLLYVGDEDDETCPDCGLDVDDCECD